MIYANLIYFLVAIFSYTTAAVPEQSWLPPLGALALYGAAAVVFDRICAFVYKRVRPVSARRYFTAERKLSILGLLLFGGFVYLLDLRYYLHALSLGDRLPFLENGAGLAVFFAILSLMWRRARPVYEQVFGRRYTSRSFLISNIRINLPIVLPWLFLSFVFDLVALGAGEDFQKTLNSAWGDLLLFLVFLGFLCFVFPPLVRRLWGCRPLPPGPLLRRIQAFCQSQGFASEVLSWPLFEGQVLTAAIMGIVPRFRYLLLTPALLATLDEDELNSVLAHEIGHVKRKHLLLYVLLFLGFSFLAGALAEPIPYFVLATDTLYTLCQWSGQSPDTLLAVATGLVVLVFMLVYFRFIFGYFIRNFERQADLYVFAAQGTCGPLVRSFEKIAYLSGNIKNEKSWHHFGIGERIDFLLRCEEDPALIRRHDRKVLISLICYFFLVSAVVLGMRQVDTEALASGYELRYAEAVLRHKVRAEPQNSLWLQLLGDLMQKQAMEKKAIEAYERALALQPMNADVNNNLAWLLLTARDRTLRDPARALTLARTAAMLKQEGYILDTLATAFWANNLLEEALQAEMQALRTDPENGRYYREQMEKFRSRSWRDF